MQYGLPEDTFAGITVLDFSRLLPGPFCTQLLRDLGARVIKIEPVQGGDYARWYPPRIVDGDDGHGAFFDAVNRGKESVALDLKHPEGQAIARRLIRQADVLVEGFRPGVMERLGLGAEVLRHEQPQLIVARISGFGQTGPRAMAAGHDLGYQAAGGALGLLQPVNDAPQVPALLAADLAGGAVQAAFAIAAALFRRMRTYQGVELDIAMSEGVTWLLSPLLQHAVSEGEMPPGAHMLTGGVPAYRLYGTADGRQLAVAALEPHFWSAFCEVIERPDLAASGLATGEEGQAVATEVGRVIARESLDVWRERLDAQDVCVEPVLSWTEVLSSAQAHARESLRVESGRVSVRAPGAERVPAPRAAPRLGEHTQRVLRALGESDTSLAELRDAGVIGGSAAG